jgi:hypothetical protein
MATAVFPTELPDPLISDYNDQIGEGRVITKTSTGVGKRRAFWPGLKTVSVSYNLSVAEYLALRYFYEVTLRGGVDPFMWFNPAEGSFLTTSAGDIITDTFGNAFAVPGGVRLLVQFAPQNPIRRSQAYTSNVVKTDISLEVLP